MEGYISFTHIVPPILNFNTRLRWVANFTILAAWPLGKNSWYPLNRRVGKPNSQCLCSPPRNQTPVHLVHSLSLYYAAMVHSLSLYYNVLVHNLSLYYVALVHSLSLYYAALVHSLSLYYAILTPAFPSQILENQEGPMTVRNLTWHSTAMVV